MREKIALDWNSCNWKYPAELCYPYSYASHDSSGPRRIRRPYLVDDIQHQLPQDDCQDMLENVVILLSDWARYAWLIRPTTRRRFYETLELYGLCVFLFLIPACHLHNIFLIVHSHYSWLQMEFYTREVRIYSSASRTCCRKGVQPLYVQWGIVH